MYYIRLKAQRNDTGNDVWRRDLGDKKSEWEDVRECSNENVTLGEWAYRTGFVEVVSLSKKVFKFKNNNVK